MDERAFIAGVAHRLHCDPRHAESLTFVILQELRDRLTPHEAADVAAQLPPGLKLLWTENDSPDRPVMRVGRREFVRRVRRWAALGDDREAESAVKAVFAVLQTLLGRPLGLGEETRHVFTTLPRDMKTLWLAASRSRN